MNIRLAAQKVVWLEFKSILNMRQVQRVGAYLICSRVFEIHQTSSWKACRRTELQRISSNMDWWHLLNGTWTSSDLTSETRKRRSLAESGMPANFMTSFLPMTILLLSHILALGSSPSLLRRSGCAGFSQRSRYPTPTLRSRQFGFGQLGLRRKNQDPAAIKRAFSKQYYFHLPVIFLW